MTGRLQNTPWASLTRHFFQTLFRLRFLDDTGEESFKRAIIGVLAGIVALGLFLGRLRMGKYVMLAARPAADAYQSILAADQLLMICLPMWTIGLVMAFASQAVFPDEVDFRILTPLPLSRRTIFSAKCAAVFGFATIFSVVANVGFGLPLTLVSGRGSTQPLGARVLAQIAAGLLASAFVVASLIALTGLATVLIPRAWVRKMSVGIQTVLICALVLSIPVVARIPALWPSLQAKPSWLFLIPPAWFLGVEQWMLGSHDRYFGQLALAAMLGTSLVLLVGSTCYLIIYRRFDRLVLLTAKGHPPSRWNARLRLPVRRHPATEAIQEFTSATLRRSGLHQVVWLGMFAAGFALVVNNLLGTIGLSERWLMRAVLGTPLTLMTGAVIGLRMALLIPTNLRAGWIFQLTEESANRPHELNAVRRVLIGVGVIAPVILSFPLYVAVLGTRRSLTALPVVLLLGWMFVEAVSVDWRRIPFTCTFLFARRPPAYTVFLAVSIFGWFVFIGTSLIYAAISGPMAWLVVCAVLAIIEVGLRAYRLQTWGRAPLEFEDSLPDSLNTLRLN